MELFDNNLSLKVESIVKGLWTINPEEFYVELEIKAAGESYYRTINKNELAAIKTQIDVSDCESAYFEDFKQIYSQIKKYQKFVSYLNLQGITQFEKIERKTYKSFENLFSIGFSKICKNNWETKYISKTIQHSAFRVIGEIILTNDNPYVKLQPYIQCIFGTILHDDTIKKVLSEFMDNQPADILFDKCKLGHEFCLFFSNHLLKTNQEIISRDDKLCEAIYSLKKTESNNFSDAISNTFYKNNLLFIKVERPAHCYHCILSIAKIIQRKTKKMFYFNEKALIFCQSDGKFAEKIHDIPKTSDQDTKNFKHELTYFFIHPEILNEEDHSLLVEFVNTRFNSIRSKNLPKVVVISSISYKNICFKHSKKFDEVEFNITDDLLPYLYELSKPLVNKAAFGYDDCHYHLYYSERAGAGKTYQIFNDFEASKNNEDDKLSSFFIDVSSHDLPIIDDGCDYVHYDLSPDLFDNDYRFFDNMWVFATLKYYIKPDGNEMKTPRNLYFEVPTLTNKQYPEGGFISEYDFPIYVDEYHKISVKDDEGKTDKKDKEKDDIHNEIKTKILENKNSFYNIIKFSDIKIELPESVKKFCPRIFGKQIDLTYDLLLTAARIFYKGFEFKKSNFIPRILEEFNLFMKEFCEGLQIEEEKSLAIFILLLRTNFHVWNFESLFDEKKSPKSFIIMANQSLFSNKPDQNKWNLLCFSSTDETIEWDTSYFSQPIKEKIGEIKDSTLLDNNFFRDLKNDENIAVYSNHLNYANDQIYFFNIIRSFFYNINDPSNNYCQITDGVILNNFNQSENYEKLQNYLEEIYDGKEAYERNSKNKAKEIQDWTNELDIIGEIFRRYEPQPKDLIEMMTTKEEIKSICNMTLTMTIVKRFVIMIIRIILKQPIIFEGFTGVGKTLSVQLLSTLIKITPVDKNLSHNDGFMWSYHQIDCNGALQLDEVLKILDLETNKADQLNLKQVFFFDELNTSPISSYIINEMNNYYMKSKYYNDKSIVFIAAINPYLKINNLARSLSRVGIKQIIPNRISKLRLCRIPPSDIHNIYEYIDLNKLAYNVRELSYSSRMIVLQSDPEFFKIDGSEPQSELFYPPDESMTVYHIIMIYLNSLMDQTYISVFEEDNKGKKFLKLKCHL